MSSQQCHLHQLLWDQGIPSHRVHHEIQKILGVLDGHLDQWHPIERKTLNVRSDLCMGHIICCRNPFFHTKLQLIITVIYYYNSKTAKHVWKLLMPIHQIFYNIHCI